MVNRIDGTETETGLLRQDEFAIDYRQAGETVDAGSRSVDGEKFGIANGT